MTSAAIGFADHTGWAIAVVVAGAERSFDVVHRERIRIVDDSLPAQAYHAVTERGMPAAVIKEVEASALSCALAEIARIRMAVSDGGCELVAAAVPVSTAAVPASLEAIFKRHTMWHAAEGNLYREALAEASAQLGLRVLRIPRKEVESFAEGTGTWDASRLAEEGKRLGPPWQADHRLAATAAWCALQRAGAPRQSGRDQPMTSVAEPDAKPRIRTIVFMPSERSDCVASARMPFEDYLRLDIEGIAEWVDGEVRVYMSVSHAHQRIVVFLTTLMNMYSDIRGLGVVLTAPYLIRPVPDGAGREPDLIFLRMSNLEARLSSHFAGVPDLAVEVVSPDGVERDYVEKFREYEAAGIPEYWVIDSREGHERADFFVLRDGRYDIVQPEDGIYRSAIIEGFWLKLEWLWDPEPRVAKALEEVLGRPLA